MTRLRAAYLWGEGGPGEEECRREFVCGRAADDSLIYLILMLGRPQAGPCRERGGA